MVRLADILLISLTPLAYLATAIYFGTQKTPVRTGLRSAFSAGLSLTATLAAGLLSFLPGEAYYLGLRGLLPVVLLWIVFPLLAGNIVPGLVGETIGSPLTYLEKRFGTRTARIATLLYVVGRVALAAVIVAGLSRMLAVAMGSRVPPMWIVLGLGLFSLLFGSGLGLRGGTWMNVLMAALIAIGIPVAVAVVIKANGGAEKLWSVAYASQRTWIADPTVDLGDSGVVWNLLPFAWTAMLVMFLGDEATAVRLSQLKSVGRVRGALATLFAGVSILSIALMYLGIGTFAYFSEQGEQLRAKWVANVEPSTRLTRTIPETQSVQLEPKTGEPAKSLLREGPLYDPTTGEPILAWDAADIRRETLDELIADKKLYVPNREYPLATAAEVLDETGDAIDPRKLAGFTLQTPERPSEMLLHRRATEETWPHFLALTAEPGLFGLLLAGLLAASLAAMDLTGVVASPALTKLTSRGAIHAWILTGVLTVCVTSVAMWFTRVLAFPAEAMIYVAAASLGPIAAIVMLGLTSRRAGDSIALMVLLSGVVGAIAVCWFIMSRPHRPLHPMWSLTLSFVVTFVWGHLLALLLGRSAKRGQLRGLVLGIAPIGSLQEVAPVKMVALNSEQKD